MQPTINKTASPKLFFKFYPYLFRYRKTVILQILLGTVVMLLGLVNPFITKLVIDQAINKRNLQLFLVLGAIGAGIFLINSILGGASGYLKRYLGLKIKLDLRRRLAKHLSELPLVFFQEKPLGRQLYRINFDVDFVSEFLTNALPEIVGVFLPAILTLIIMFYLDKRVAVLSVCLAPVAYLCPYIFSKSLKEFFRELSRGREAIYSKFISMFSRIYLIRAFGRGFSEVRSYLKRVVANIRLEISSIKLRLVSNFLGGVVIRLASGIIAFYGGYLVIKGQMTLGSLMAIMIYLGQLFSLQERAANFFLDINFAAISCGRINDILEEKIVDSGPEQREAVVFSKGEIVFQDCAFGYRKEAKVLDGINFKIEGGSAVALAGASGSGKTTIINLILRLYEPQAGAIFIDGKDIKCLKAGCIYSQIGLGPQEPLLSDDSVEENIKYGNPDATDDEMVKAAEITGVDILVKSLPEGYQTKVGEEIGRFSEGQKQRISISRAVIKRSQILILDEALSSLDVESEKKILTKLLKERNGQTTIIISHRQSALEIVDKIYFLEDKNKVSVGSFQQLLSASDAFSNLFNQKPV